MADLISGKITHAEITLKSFPRLKGKGKTKIDMIKDFGLAKSLVQGLEKWNVALSAKNMVRNY